MIVKNLDIQVGDLEGGIVGRLEGLPLYVSLLSLGGTSCCHRSDSNWLPWSVVMDVGMLKRAKASNPASKEGVCHGCSNLGRPC